MNNDYALYTSDQFNEFKSYWENQLNQFKYRFNFSELGSYNNDKKMDEFLFEIDPKTVELLKIYSKDNAFAQFILLKSAYTLVLNKVMKEGSVVIETPRYKDTLDSTDLLIEENVVICSLIEENESLKKFLQKEKETLSTSYKFQGYPIDVLIEDKSSHGSNVYMSDSSIHTSLMDTSGYDFMIEMNHNESQISHTIKYNKNLYTLSYIQMICKTVQTILNQYSNLDILLNDLIYTDEADRQEQISLLTNYSSLEFVSLIDMFKIQLKNNPEAISIRNGNEVLTYKELDRLSDALAVHLLDKEVPGTRVAIVLDRSSEMLVSIIGILKAGMCYVPIDTKNSRDRINYILEDVKPHTVITSSEYMFMIEQFNGELFLADIQLRELKTQSVFLPEVVPNHLAYVLYTSGSTGKPKGVMITHENIFNYIKYAIDTYATDLKDMSLFSNIGFDFTQTSVFMPLLTGGTVHVYNDEAVENVLKEIFVNSGNECVKLTPAHIDILKFIEIPNTSIKNVIVGGDVLKQHHVDLLNSINSNITIFNEYGPTETTVGCIVEKIKSGTFLKTIGRPIQNTSIYILDDKQKIVPRGVIGEIAVSGLGVAIGYINKKNLTEKKFLDNHFSDNYEKMYLTGDLGRITDNGAIEYVGRNDRQVKIRGYRIELEEIEHVLLENLKIDDIVVTPSEDGNTRVLSLAWVGEATEAEITKCVEQNLPDYMWPKKMLKVSELPINSNGKKDYKFIEKLIVDSSFEKKEIQLPETELEIYLHEIWSEVLGKKDISVTDDYFEMGGDSIIGIQIVSRLDQDGYVLDIKDLFNFPTIRELSDKVELKSTTLAPIVPITNTDDYSISNAQRNLWIINQLNGSLLAYHMPFAEVFSGALDLGVLEQCFNEIVARHEILRTSFIDVNGEPCSKIYSASETSFAFNKINMINAENETEEIEHYIKKDLETPFQLDKPGLFRISLFECNEERYIFFMNMSHMISDGWSIEILLSELQELYNSKLENRPPNIEPVVFQYKDYCAYVNQKSDLETASKFWNNMYDNKINTLDLQPDYSTESSVSFKGEHFAIELNAEKTEKINNFSRKYNSSLFTTFLALLNVVLYKRSGQTDLVVGTPTAGRERPEFEKMIGLFLNTLALRNQLDVDATFDSFMREVRERVLNCFSHQDYPYDMLVSDLKNNGVLGVDESLFKVLLVAENFTASSETKDLLNLNGTTHTHFPIEYQISKSDLGFSFVSENDVTHLTIEYNSELYMRSSISDMVEDFVQLIDVVCEESFLTIRKICEKISSTEEVSEMLAFDNTLKTEIDEEF